MLLYDSQLDPLGVPKLCQCGCTCVLLDTPYIDLLASHTSVSTPVLSLYVLYSPLYCEVILLMSYTSTLC